MANLFLFGKPPGRAAGTLSDLLDNDFVDEYLVRTDDPLVDRLDIIEFNQLPDIYDRYSNVPGTFGYYACVKEKDAKQSPDSPFLWAVTVRYSTKVSEERRQTLDPLDRPPIYKKKSQRATRACEYDDKGKSLVNSAALPFDPPYEREENNVLLTVIRNEPSLDLSRDQEFEDSVNDAAWFGGAPGTWKCLSIEGDEAFDRNTYFVTNTFQFLYKRSGWTGYFTNGGILKPDKTRILDRGKAERLNGQVQIIYDSRLHPIPDPVCLDGRGLRLDPGPDRATTLTAALSAAGTTVTVHNPKALVQGQQATIITETVIIDTVNVATKTITLVRGVDGTTPADYIAGDVIYQKSGTSTQLKNNVVIGQVFVEVVDPLVFGFVQRLPGGTIVFPAYGITPFIRIDQEEMLVTNVLGQLLQVVRGANGSTPAVHTAPVEVRQAPTYVDFDLLKLKHFQDLNLGG